MLGRMRPRCAHTVGGASDAAAAAAADERGALSADALRANGGDRMSAALCDNSSTLEVIEHLG
eukprot:SAG11_NODE_4956_length_1711_cov_1.112283_2_plen_63_part_00